MDMSKKSMVRRLILEQLGAVFPCGVVESTLKVGLKTAGVILSNQELLAELSYLLEKGFVSTKRDELSISIIYYFITSQGLDVLDS